MAFAVKPPAWFWLVAIVLVAWNVSGVYFCVDQIQHGAASSMWDKTPYHQAFYAKLPSWYNYVYAVATFGGLLGALALLLREKRSRLLFWLALIAVVVMFGYTFGATDLIAHDGAKKVVPFPIFIAAVGLFSIWFANLSARRGWLGAR